MINTLAHLLASANTNGVMNRASLEDISKSRPTFNVNLPWGLVLVLLGLVVLLVALISIRRWWVHRNDEPTHLMLYSAIARKAGLSWSDRLLLWRIARRCSLATPITLLLARGALTHHTKAYRETLSHRRAVRVSQQVQRIRVELFGS